MVRGLEDLAGSLRRRSGSRVDGPLEDGRRTQLFQGLKELRGSLLRQMSREETEEESELMAQIQNLAALLDGCYDDDDDDGVEVVVARTRSDRGLGSCCGGVRKGGVEEGEVVDLALETTSDAAAAAAASEVASGGNDSAASRR